MRTTREEGCRCGGSTAVSGSPRKVEKAIDKWRVSHYCSEDEAPETDNRPKVVGGFAATERRAEADLTIESQLGHEIPTVIGFTRNPGT